MGTGAAASPQVLDLKLEHSQSAGPRPKDRAQPDVGTGAAASPEVLDPKSEHHHQPAGPGP